MDVDSKFGSGTETWRSPRVESTTFSTSDTSWEVPGCKRRRVCVSYVERPEKRGREGHGMCDWRNVLQGPFETVRRLVDTEGGWRKGVEGIRR